jgi:hypothetical protein
MLPRGSFERMVLDSAAGKATATFLNGEIVFRGISLKLRVEKQKPAETSIGSLEASNGRRWKLPASQWKLPVRRQQNQQHRLESRKFWNLPTFRRMLPK